MNYTLITGASQGIGEALAREFAKEGANLILTARSEEALLLLAEELKSQYNITVHTFTLDLLASNAVEDLYEWCAGNKYQVRVLVNNAGVGLYGGFEDIALESYMEMLQLNQSILLSMCYIFLPMLKEVPKAHILNVASVAAYHPTPYLSAYGGSKAFVLMFSQALRQELMKYSINVSCLCPGPTDTNFFTAAGFDTKLEDIKNMLMTPDAVAEKAVDGLFRNQAVIIPGFTNKFGTFLGKLIPSGLLTDIIAFGLKPKKKIKKH